MMRNADCWSRMLSRLTLVRNGPLLADSTTNRMRNGSAMPACAKQRARRPAGTAGCASFDAFGGAGGSCGHGLTFTGRHGQATCAPGLSLNAALSTSCSFICVAAEVGDEPAASHHEHPVGEAEHLLDVGGDDQDAEAPRRLFGDELVDRPARADVDAAGRLVRDEQRRLAEQPAGEQHLLLVAATEGPHRRVQVLHPDRQVLDQLLGHLSLEPWPDETRTGCRRSSSTA